MDIVRDSNSNKKKLRRIAFGAAIVIALIVASVALARLEPAAPAVEAGSLVIETVTRGPMTRMIRRWPSRLPLDQPAGVPLSSAMNLLSVSRGSTCPRAQGRSDTRQPGRLTGNEAWGIAPQLVTFVDPDGYELHPT